MRARVFVGCVALACALAPRAAAAQATEATREVQGLGAQTSAPPPASSTSLLRALVAETQLRVGVALVPDRFGTEASPYRALPVPFAAQTGFWILRWLSAGAHASVAPVLFTPLEPPPPADPAAAMREPFVLPRYRVGVYGTLHLGGFFRSGGVFDPALTLGASAGALANPAVQAQALYLDALARASLSVRVAHGTSVGPYLEATTYGPIGCPAPREVTCTPRPYAEVELGLALTLTTPPWPTPEPPRRAPPPAPTDPIPSRRPAGGHGAAAR